MVKTARLFVYSLMLLMLARVCAADLTATVDRRVVSDGQTINLTLRSDSLSLRGPQPDFSPLEKDFDILGSRQSNQIRMINGRNEAWVEWNLTLMPKRLGSLTIPPLQSQGDSSNPITVEVRKASAANAADAPVFMRNSLSANNIWQGQEAILTLNIYTRAEFADNPDLTPLKIEGAIIKVLDNQQQNEEIIGGVKYTRITLQYLITPTQPGQLTIPEQTLTGAVVEQDPYSGSSFFRSSRPRPFRVRAPRQALHVNAIPASWPADKPWLPAKQVTISEAWSANTATLNTGDSVTRTVTIRAQGSNSALIPPLPPLDIAGVKSYPDQPRIEDKRAADGSTLGVRSESTALVPTQPGTITLPAATVTWFNTTTRTIEIARLEGQSLVVSGSPAASTPAPKPVTPANIVEPTPESQNPVLPGYSQATDRTLIYWQVATLLFALLWLITLAAWFRRTRLAKTINPLGTATKQTASEKQLFQQLVTSCEQNDYGTMERALLRWGQTILSQPKLFQSEAVIHALHNPPLTDGWQQLQRGRFQKDADGCDTGTLIPLLQQARSLYLNPKKAAATGQAPTINP